MNAAMRDRIVGLAEHDCSGYECGGTTARFTRRLINGAVTVHLQCQNCGRSMAGPLKRDQFYHWQDFPLWEEEIRTRHNETSREKAAGSLERWKAEVESKAAQRRDEYRRWLLTSPHWADLRMRVMVRARRACEACLSAAATDVHHVTYRLGRLPPAWELRAVCRNCHDRLHDWTGGEE